MLNYTQYEEKQTLCAGGKSNTISSQWGQEFAPAPQHKQSAPAMFDCGCDLKSLLTLTHFALEALDDERFWHFLISSVSLFQPLLKCPPHQNQLKGPLLDLKRNRDEIDPNLP